MKKKIFGTILAAALLVTNVVTAFAAGSREANLPSLTNDMAGRYEIVSITEESFPELKESAPEVLETIMKVNSKEATLDAIAKIAPDIAPQLEGKSLLGDIFDLREIDAEKNANGKFEVTISVPTLTEAVSEVAVLHYSTVRGLWEIIEPKNVDKVNKTVTAEFEDLSPVAVIAKINTAATTGDAAGTTATGTSPKTGVSSDWMMWIAAAVVLGAAGTAVYRRANRA